MIIDLKSFPFSTN